MCKDECRYLASRSVRGYIFDLLVCFIYLFIYPPFLKQFFFSTLDLHFIKISFQTRYGYFTPSFFRSSLTRQVNRTLRAEDTLVFCLRTNQPLEHESRVLFRLINGEVQVSYIIT